MAPDAKDDPTSDPDRAEPADVNREHPEIVHPEVAGEPLDYPLQEGPGVGEVSDTDWSLWGAIFFVAIGWIPASGYRATLGIGHFGPLEIPAILTMVGVFFAIVGLLRAIDAGNKTLRTRVLFVGALGMVRLFLAPLF